LLLALPPAQRAVVLLRYQEDLLPGENAETLEMPLATVKSHLQRALRLLRARAEGTLKEYTRHG
jgi:RNA polymerase sigma-70 factor (ECF subfamily)